MTLPLKLAKLREIAERADNAKRIDDDAMEECQATFGDPKVVLELLACVSELEKIAKQDLCVYEPNAIWLINWRHDTKRAAQAALEKLERVLG